MAERDCGTGGAEPGGGVRAVSQQPELARCSPRSPTATASPSTTTSARPARTSRRAPGCWSPPRPGRARRSSASSRSSWPCSRAASASTPPRSRRCPTRSTPTWSAGTAPANVGLLTGDSSINSEAPVVVMTTEVLRNMIYAGSATLRNLGFVVMDEVHYLADRFRGAVWEEVIIGLAESIQVVALSATVSNAEEFGEWLAEVRGEMAVVVSERRPVPLFQHVMVGRNPLRPVRRRRADRPARRRSQAKTRGQPGAGPGRPRGVPLRPRRLPSAPGPQRQGQADRQLRQRRYGGAAHGSRSDGPSRRSASPEPARRWSSCWTTPRCCRRSSSSSPGSAATPPYASCSPRVSG